MAKVLKPPMPLNVDGPSVFLAGSIGMGASVDWQRRVEAELDVLDVTILNPRRDDWDSSWEQTIENSQFRGQVEWELDGLEMADVIAVYFAPDSKAPITLLELGLFAQSGKVIVCCPDGFWRRGNVEIVCRRFGVAMAESLDSLIAAVRAELLRGERSESMIGDIPRG